MNSHMHAHPNGLYISDRFSMATRNEGLKATHGQFGLLWDHHIAQCVESGLVLVHFQPMLQRRFIPRIPRTWLHIRRQVLPKSPERRHAMDKRRAPSTRTRRSFAWHTEEKRVSDSSQHSIHCHVMITTNTRTWKPHSKTELLVQKISRPRFWHSCKI